MVPLCLSGIQPAVVTASLDYLLLAVTLPGNPNQSSRETAGNLTVRWLLLPVRNMLCGWDSSFTWGVSLACWTVLGCVKRCRFKELCVLSSCNYVQFCCLPVCTNSLLSSSTQFLAYFQPIKSKKASLLFLSSFNLLFLKLFFNTLFCWCCLGRCENAASGQN